MDLRRAQAPHKRPTAECTSFKARDRARLLCLLIVGGFAKDYVDTESVASESVKYQLGLIGSSIYEYHSRTGRWPAQLDDLAQTSLPVQSYNWKLWVPPFVILWHNDLKPDPKNNATVVLAYHNRGLLAELRRKRVLWGDLRTQYVKIGRLSAILDQEAKANPLAIPRFPPQDFYTWRS